MKLDQPDRSNFVEKPRRCWNDDPLGSLDVHHHQLRWRMLIEEYIERHHRHYPIAALADSTDALFESNRTLCARSETAASITSTVRLLSPGCGGGVPRWLDLARPRDDALSGTTRIR